MHRSPSYRPVLTHAGLTIRPHQVIFRFAFRKKAVRVREEAFNLALFNFFENAYHEGSFLEIKYNTGTKETVKAAGIYF